MLEVEGLDNELYEYESYLSLAITIGAMFWLGLYALNHKLLNELVWVHPILG